MTGQHGGAPDPVAFTVDQALAAARRKGLDRLDAQLLLAHHLGRARTWVLAHGESGVDVVAADAYARDCDRRADDWPLAYLLGSREFHGLPLRVTPAVLVPRPETETLVDWALELLTQQSAARPQALDLGTGSGAVALALKQACPEVQMSASDLCPLALGVARENARSSSLVVEFVQGTWWAAMVGRQFDLVVSNPPYIAAADGHLPALRHEPQLALCAGPDGLAALRTIVAGAPRHLRPGAWMLLEHGFDQGDAVRALLDQAGFADISTRHDLEDRPRCSAGRWTGLGTG